VPSIRTPAQRKFVPAANYLDKLRIEPARVFRRAHTRGKASQWATGKDLYSSMVNPMACAIAIELAHDGKRLVAINDATGRESLLIFNPEGAASLRTFCRYRVWKSRFYGCFAHR